MRAHYLWKATARSPQDGPRVGPRVAGPRSGSSAHRWPARSQEAPKGSRESLSRTSAASGATTIADTRDKREQMGARRGARAQSEAPRGAQQARKRLANTQRKPSGALLAVGLLALLAAVGFARGQLHQDPKPTIYSGQVSFGLLLSAHGSPGADMSTAASQLEASWLSNASRPPAEVASASGGRLQRRQIFEKRRPASNRWSSPADEDQAAGHTSGGGGGGGLGTSGASAAASGINGAAGGECSQVNANALFAGMGAIWASHQANLVGDSQLAIGTYVYDSCNDLEIGQRQSVRIVSNLNAFQQTTCEAPRGSPISLTVAHGDNQLPAIGLLTSFRVPVVSTREHFALEDYQTLSDEQRRYLFSTAHSSRHLALGAVRFARRIVARAADSPKLANHYFRTAPRNGLIVISQNLPGRFIKHLTEMIPYLANYELLTSSQPIEQIRSLEALESLLMGRAAAAASAAAAAESRHHPRRLEPSASVADEPAASTLDNDEPFGPSEAGGLPGALLGAEPQERMLSPTVLMFITPAEAIDLVTRLRNDLAEVSRYYSLIVVTRDDISPALRTIFRKGGSGLCSGKAFYTISPRPDEIDEFSRYFRDTVQVEGESSDHPLVGEFARHQAAAGGAASADLDDVATEPVIKAVWAAAAAFKSVYRRECAALAATSGEAPTAGAGAGQAAPQQLSAGIGPKQQATAAAAAAAAQASSQSPLLAGHKPAGTAGLHNRGVGGGARGPQSGKPTSAHVECLVRMNKNMAQMVQRALKRIEVQVNSTGLQSLDGFKIKFDELNELATNKFSIKYINKDCEMSEIGHYTGLANSMKIDKEALAKSLEGALPEAWPAPAKPARLPPTASASPLPASTTGGFSGARARQVSVSGEEELATPATKAVNAASTSQQQQQQQEGRRSRLQPTTLAGNDEPSAATSASSSARDELKSEPEEEEEPAPLGGRQASRARKRPRADEAGGERKRAGSQLLLTTMAGGLADASVTSATQTSRPAQERRSRHQSTGEPSAGIALGAAKPDDELPTTLSAANGHAQSSTSVLVKGAPRWQTTVQPGQRTTLPESDGNADLEAALADGGAPTRASTDSAYQLSDTLASSTVNSQNYVTAPSFGHKLGYYQPTTGEPSRSAQPPASGPSNRSEEALDLLPVASLDVMDQYRARLESLDPGSVQRSRFRSHIKWIYSNWYTLSILCANILGALLTLYVLTFLLMRNSDGSLERDSQSFRSVLLLAIIVVFFGSTLFIVYPTPSLCLLRASWHNSALAMLFGALLLQAMQARAASSLGLGGRVNKLNQFLTLLFIVGVQLAAEAQRWRYESAQYSSFMGQYLGSLAGGRLGARHDPRLSLLLLQASAAAPAAHFKPFSAFNDQVTPLRIQASEHYQSLVRDYCLQRADDFLMSQIYLCLLVALLVLLSLANRRRAQLSGASAALARSHQQHQHLGPAAGKPNKLAGGAGAAHHQRHQPDSSHLSSASAGSSSHFQLTSASPSCSSAAAVAAAAVESNVCLVSLLSSLVYLGSLALHGYAPPWLSSSAGFSEDLASSLCMVLVAFTALIGVFVPVLLRLRRESRATPLLGSLADGSTSSTRSQPTALSGSVLSGGQPVISARSRATRTRSSHYGPAAQGGGADSLRGAPGSQAFALFPEFAQTGLRRPASVGESTSVSSAGAGSRRLFVNTNESRRNMSAALADLGPSDDSLRSMGFYGSLPKRAGDELEAGAMRGAADTAQAKQVHQQRRHQGQTHQHHQHRRHTEHQQAQPSRERQSQSATGHTAKVYADHQAAARQEKRLIMLDVDPCCPRHGHAAERECK